MGNKVGKLSLCCAGDAGDISRRMNGAVGLPPSDPFDEDLGHAFCYTPPDHGAAVDCAVVVPTHTAPFRTISGAFISANTSTALTTNAALDYVDNKASAFESSDFFSSTSLQPIPKTSASTATSSGTTPRHARHSSCPPDRGFLSSRPVDRSFFISGPLENHPHMPKSRKHDLVNNLKKMMPKPFWASPTVSKNNKNDQTSNTAINAGLSSSNISGNNSILNSKNLSSDMSLMDENDDDLMNIPFSTQNLQWAQAKAGEDRVHLVISDEHDWIFVGIYDGFNGPDATDFLLNNLYSNVHNELNGILWPDKNQPHDTTINNTNHSRVLKALCEALRRTEGSYLDIADMMLSENPELALMGSCVLAMVMKGDDVYLMNAGDSRAVLAQKNVGGLYAYNECGDEHCLSARQLTMDHSTSVKEEVRRIRNEHSDDPCAVANDRVKGSLKVTRAFGAGYLKQPKWNDALLEMFRIEYVGNSPYITCSPALRHHKLDPNDKFLILSSDGLYQYFTNDEAVSEVGAFISTFPDGDPAQHLVEEVLFRAAEKAGISFHELLDIPQGDRRRYHDDVSIIIISFEGRIWQSSM